LTATQTQKQGQGWFVYSGILLLVVGVKMVLDGLWALDHKDDVLATSDGSGTVSLYWSDNLGTWGWIYLITGIVILAGGIGLFSRQPWARVVGIAAGVLGIIINFFYLFAYPWSALVGILLASLVVYGLTVYGDDDNEAAY
jgi:hypothetical protein